jgi:Flp pilus assembly pilin Flp
MVVKKGGERTMEFLKRLVVEEEGQGLVEYTLIVLLVALVFWVAVRAANVDDALSSSWGSITACLTGPFACAGGS